MQKKAPLESKPKLHRRNLHLDGYDFDSLCKTEPELSAFVKINEFNQRKTIDFSNAVAVKLLNKSLLKTHYSINYWDIPENYLCPPIPGRADYVHHIADLLCSSNYGNIPINNSITCLDIGIGANCIYPLLGRAIYGWNFIGSDCNADALISAQKIIDENELLTNNVTCRYQKNSKDILYNILTSEDKIDITICNPPFHSSAQEALKAAIKKESNLLKKPVSEPNQNFKGQHNELWCDGGEERFITKFVYESKKFSTNIFWFTCLVSKQSHLKSIYKSLDKAQASEVKTIPMGQGNKTSRIVAWTFLTKEEQKEWKDERWNSSKTNE